jgi:hypothetical protein
MFFTKTSHTIYFNATFFIASNMKQGINLTMMSTLKELRVYKTICKHASPLHQYMNRKISMGYVFSPTSYYLLVVSFCYSPSGVLYKRWGVYLLLS